MAGRPRKPADWHVLNGNPGHKTKKDLERHKAAEVRLGTSILKMPAIVRRDAVARKKWNELKNLYEGIEFVSSSDVGAIAQLCLAYSELENLHGHLQTVQNIEPFDYDEEKTIRKEFEDKRGERGAEKLWQKVEFISSLPAIQSLNKSIDSKRAIIRSLEDRLFLNPLAKIRNVPKKEVEKKEDPLQSAGFGNV